MLIKRFLIQGIVQGVGFRYFARRAARELRLSGFVRNLADGSVEVLARGEEGQLLLLGEALGRGPAASRVDSVKVEDHPGAIDEDGFVIR